MDEPQREEKYGGDLYDTTCKAWMVISGGAVFGDRDADGKVPVYGVVTHSFDVGLDGKPYRQYVGQDGHGMYGTTNFSPFSEAKDLKAILQRNRQP